MFEGDRLHRRDRRQLEEAGRGVGRDTGAVERSGELVEACGEEGGVRHGASIPPAPDGSYGAERCCQAFSTSRSTRASDIDATKLIAPAASTRAPAGVS
jgi:hypothetical protein